MTYLRSFIDDPEIAATPIINVSAGAIATNSKIPSGSTVSSINGTTINLNTSTTSALNLNEVVIFSSNIITKSVNNAQSSASYSLNLSDVTNLSAGQLVTHPNVPVGTTITQVVSSSIVMSNSTTSPIASGQSIKFSSNLVRKTVAAAQSVAGTSFIISSINSSKVNGNSAILNLDGNFTANQTFSEGLRSFSKLTLPIRSINNVATINLTSSDCVIYYTGTTASYVNLPTPVPSTNLFLIIANRSSATLTLTAPSVGNGSINQINSDILITSNTSIRLHHKGSNVWVTI